jgi:hypothetical protein
VDPLTGGATGGAVDPATGAVVATATPMTLTGGRTGQAKAAAWVAAIALAMAVLVPPFLLRRSRSRR